MTEFSDSASVPQQSASPPPLASFDAGGAPSVISYQTPESTSYGGRHVLELDYTLGDFAGVVAVGGQTSAEQGGSTGGPVAPAATGPSLSDSVSVPRSVVLSDSTVGQNPVIGLAPFELTDRLAALRWADVHTAAGAQKQIDVYRSIGGLLDYRVRDISQAKPPTVQQTGSPSFLIAPAEGKSSPNGGSTNGSGNGSGSGTAHIYITMSIDSPDGRSPLPGPSNGLNLPVMGSFDSHAGPVDIVVDLLTESLEVVREVPGTVTGSTGWTASLPVTASGTWKIRATAKSQIYTKPLVQGDDIVDVVVNLSGGTVNGGGPAHTPSVWITSPRPNYVILIPPGSKLAGSAVVSVAVGFDTGGGSAVTLGISADGGTPQQVQPPPDSREHTFDVLLSGAGRHAITATAVNQDKVSAPPVTVPVALEESVPVLPLDRRLLLIEKIAITSFLGDFGAGRLVKTFSLLPGEQTVISIDTYTKDETTAKSASSILDSTATECGADFEDTVNNENDTKAANSDAMSASISADIGSNWGWGSASIKGNYSDSANSSRENTVKTVTNALAKHTSKASSNRTVSVNTDFSQTTSTGNTTDTTRTLTNINVSRVLNFVFRQMTQEHTVIIHLTDATLGYYALDVLLGADGNPQTNTDGSMITRETFTEYTLPEIAEFMKNQMAKDSPLERDILNVLSSIPDYTSTQQSLVEQIIPKKPDGTPDPGGTYLRVKPTLTGTYTAVGGAQYTVPGIILGVTTSVLRTDQLLCDALLGEGDALDTYSHALQEVAIAERQVAVAEREAAVAREKLAQSIVSGKDAEMAAIWQKTFPQPLSVPATVTVPATPYSSATADAAGAGS